MTIDWWCHRQVECLGLPWNKSEEWCKTCPVLKYPWKRNMKYNHTQMCHTCERTNSNHKYKLVISKRHLQVALNVHIPAHVPIHVLQLLLGKRGSGDSQLPSPWEASITIEKGQIRSYSSVTSTHLMIIAAIMKILGNISKLPLSVCNSPN